ncbi:uncharacterized protein LOC126905651 [Daktulosphaira vitifoliae]|uniref:uncharacterized protein LOC126905651 n=1 Tax=Daktulosphaira vitifoliae TaxID=58002 RepID=UPI0021AAD894|nr:uncharacterized protein LOC126905651 [Daktulosphaira vitifoliae]
MHLKTTLIFFLVCFFTITKGKGLTGTQIAHVNEMSHWYFCSDPEKLQKVLNKFGIHKEFYYNNTDTNNIRAMKILMFLVDIDKMGDDQQAEKLNIEDVQKICSEFCKIRNDGNGLIDKEQFIELIDTIEYDGLIGNAETLNPTDESKNEAILHIKEDINKDYRKDFNLASVLFKILLHRATLKNTTFGYDKNDDYWKNLFQEINKLLNVDSTSNHLLN